MRAKCAFTPHSIRPRKLGSRLGAGAGRSPALLLFALVVAAVAFAATVFLAETHGGVVRAFSAPPPPYVITTEAELRAVHHKRIMAEFADRPRFTRDMIENAYRMLRVGTFEDGSPIAVRGLRVQYIGGRLFLVPMPPERIQELYKDPNPESWSVYLFCELFFLIRTLTLFPRVPDFDVTFFHGDRCPQQYDANNFGAHDVEGAFGGPLAPVLSYSSLWDCKSVTVPTYDWYIPAGNFIPGHPFRLDSHPPPPPWEERRPVLLFRGGPQSWDGSRLRALRLTLLHPDLVDARLVTDDNGLKECFEGYRHATHPFGGPVRGSPEADCAEVRAPFTPAAEQLRFRFALDVDGHGSTARHKNLFLGGFLVFKVDSPVGQFYFDDLRPWVHYIPVDRKDLERDLPAKVRWAIANDARARRIAEAGSELVRRFVTNHVAHRYQADVLRAYAGHSEEAPEEPHPWAREVCWEELAPYAERMWGQESGPLMFKALSFGSFQECDSAKSGRPAYKPFS